MIIKKNAKAIQFIFKLKIIDSSINIISFLKMSLFSNLEKSILK